MPWSFTGFIDSVNVWKTSIKIGYVANALRIDPHH
jgi:hypothetical protein